MNGRVAKMARREAASLARMIEDRDFKLRGRNWYAAGRNRDPELRAGDRAALQRFVKRAFARVKSPSWRRGLVERLEIIAQTHELSAVAVAFRLPGWRRVRDGKAVAS